MAVSARTSARCEERIAWLLRTNRIFGPDETLATGAKFAKAFRGNDFHREIDRTQVTRWEKATQRAGYQVIRRYEELLGLARHRLVAVADGLYRSALDAPGRSYLDRELDGADPQLHRRTSALIERVVGGDLLTGSDWDELTSNLLAMPTVFLFPDTLWNEIAGRLLREMIIADGSEWLQRSEALLRLLGHPAAEPVIIAASTALVRDADNQVFVDPLTLLGFSAHSDAAQSIVGQIANPTNDHALRGAWWSAAEKLSRGHFAPSEIRMLSRYAVDLLRSSGQHLGSRMPAAEVLRRSGFAARKSSASAMRELTADRLTRMVVQSGRTGSREAAAAITSRVATSAVGMLVRDGPGDDPLVRSLIEEMLFHPQISTRSAAVRLVAATPYRFPVARALCVELGNRIVFEDPGLAPAIVYAIGILGDGEAHNRLQRLVLTNGVPRYIEETALWVLGHGRGAPADAFWKHAIGIYRNRPACLRGIIYGLGITRNVALLRACRSDTDLPYEARRAARWWLDIPSHVLDSTEKARL
jgi:hypothetical protein